jgi:hypothetical protein
MHGEPVRIEEMMVDVAIAAFNLAVLVRTLTEEDRDFAVAA